jgi:hypothetical protein
MYFEYFSRIKDELTTRYAKTLDNLGTLPASFYLEYDDNPESQGTPNLELKKSFIQPIKYKPKSSKLLDGSYHTEKLIAVRK